MDRTKLERRAGVLRGGELLDDRRKVLARIGRDPVVLGRASHAGVVVDDALASALHVELSATEDGVRLRDLSSTNGTFVGDVRVRDVTLVGPATIRIGATKLRVRPLAPEGAPRDRSTSFGALHGTAPSMRTLFERLRRIAPTELTALLLGETGTGKEVLARSIHDESPRRAGPFVVIDCGAISPSLAESLLFGHEKGAFTGALTKKQSPFAEAKGGTLFLDEVGELPIDLQPKLLRALAERSVRPVGSNRYETFDARVLAATRRDLVREVNAGSFRSDLYFRLAEVRVELPPLRERLEDVPLLVSRILEGLGADGAMARVSPITLERLMRHDWPGNVRELRNAVSAALALSDGDELLVGDYLGELSDRSAADGDPLDYHVAKAASLARFERQYFERLLARTGERNVSELARVSGLARPHVRRYLRAHGLDKVRS